MSGGSFNYLCLKDISDLWYGTGEEWDWMLQELDELCPEAAEEMRKIKPELNTFMDEMEGRWTKLQPLLQAIEWWRSNDWGKGQVDKVIEKYREENV